jgi:hypothetical protein
MQRIILEVEERKYVDEENCIMRRTVVICIRYCWEHRAFGICRKGLLRLSQVQDPGGGGYFKFCNNPIQFNSIKSVLLKCRFNSTGANYKTEQVLIAKQHRW